MTWGEVIGVGVNMVMKFCHKRKAKLHFDYLQHKKKIPELKNNFSVQSAQPQLTTTQRSNVTTKKLLCWHGTIDDLLFELDCLNNWHPDWARVQNELIDFFLGNLDKSNMSANAGIVKIVGPANIKSTRRTWIVVIMT